MSEHRPFPPSPRRLALAHRAGLHAASRHITTAVAWLAFLVVALGLGRAIAARLGAWIAAACGGSSSSTLDPASLSATALARAATPLPTTILAIALPLLAAAAIGAGLAHVAQTRALWLPRRNLADAPRIPRDVDSRALGFGAVAGAVALGWLWLAAPALAAAPTEAAGSLVASAGVALVIAAVAVGSLDAVLRRTRLVLALAMTPAERRDDERRSYADPRWRALRAKLGREDGITTDVARAALIVLGDDVAVAIAWDPIREPIPRRTTVGERAHATQLVALARRYHLPIHRDPVLAAALAATTGPVPRPHWPLLAEIIAATRRS